MTVDFLAKLRVYHMLVQHILLLDHQLSLNSTFADAQDEIVTGFVTSVKAGL